MRPSIALLFLALAALPAQARPRLAVLVVFDQLRAAELERYAPFFGEKGFGGLDGARFDAVYSYSSTETGPGHATLATGTNPVNHGVATNTWFENGKKRYVVDDEAFPVLGDGASGGRSPKSLLAPTLGDAMKADSGGKAKVVTLSHKDRSAILTGGQSADLAVWYDPLLGRYTTSKAYVGALPAWLEQAGKKLPERAFASARWSALPIPKGLEHLAPTDDRVGEGSSDVTTTFPHDVMDQPEPLRRKLYRLTPQSMDDLFALALDAVDNHDLGKDDEPDLLVVSVSTTDMVGHVFGPDSLEQLDTIRRADSALRRFLLGLETRLSARSFVVAVTSDHGGLPLPAFSETQRWPHGIVVVDDVVLVAERAVAAALPSEKKKRIAGFSPPQLSVDTSGLSPETVRKVHDAIITAVEAIDGVAHVYDLTLPPSNDDGLGPLMRAAAPPGRAAALFVRQKPRVVFLDNREKRGSDHGAPYMYDRRVPLLVAGPGVRRGRYAQPVDPRDVAATLAFLLSVPPPDMSEGKPVVAVGD